MARQTLNNGDSGAIARGTINDNYTELYASVPWLTTVAGNWYPSNPFGVLAGGGALSANIIRAIPMPISTRCTVSQMAARVTVAGTGNNQYAIYGSSAATGLPTGAALASTGSVSNAVLGATAVALGSAVQLNPGLYWAAINTDSTPTCQIIGISQGFINSIIGGTLTQVAGLNVSGITALTYTQTFGAWPDLTAVAPTYLSTSTYANLYYLISSVP